MKKNKVRELFLGLAGMFFLTGCGTQAYILTENEENVIVNYAAHTVSKHNAYQKSGLTSISLAEEETEQSEENTTESTQQTEVTPQEETFTLDDVYGEYGVNISYTGDMLAANYTESDVFDVSAPAGKQYLILNFDIANPSEDDVTVDLLSSAMTYKINYTDEKGESAEASGYTTIMTTDLSVYEETLAAGETKQAVLLFEIPNSVSEVTDIELTVTKNETNYKIKL